MKDINFLINNGVDVNKSLEIFGDIETYNDTIGDFLVALNEKIPKIDTCKNSHDMANYAILVHSLKSDAKYFGFFTLADIAYKHELASKDGNFTFVTENYEALKAEANRALDIVKGYLDGGSGDSVSKPVSQTNSVSVVPNEDLVITDASILVVDDSNIVRNFVNSSFSNTYKVIDIEDGEKALQVLRANISSDNIKCILLDLNMPKVDGFGVLNFMKENNLFDKMPVSIITGDQSKETIDKAFLYPIVDMLQKPFNEADVKKVVNRTIDTVTWI